MKLIHRIYFINTVSLAHLIFLNHNIFSLLSLKIKIKIPTGR